MKTIAIFALICSLLQAQPKLTVLTGADILFRTKSSLIDGKRVGLITNHSAVLANGVHLADSLSSYPKTTLAVMFGPEHGIRGNAPDGKTIHDGIDEKTGIPVYSLYGKINKPTPEMLKDVDVLIFDIQDIGARFYTYISTMFLGMEAAAENNIPFIVLDRPNPINGLHVEGPIRLDSLKTFVGWVPIPIVHGMTVGELAVMAVKSGWFRTDIQPNVTVVPMEQWKRSMWFDETNLPWVKPSPNMATLATATVYPGLCLIEGTNVSEGRGSERPFEYIGAPWIDGKALTDVLNALRLPGVTFSPIQFTPKEIPNVASNPKHKETICNGVYVRVTDRNVFKPVAAGIAVVWGIHSLYKDSLQFRIRGFDRLAGTPIVRQGIIDGKPVNDIISSWKNEENNFSSVRKNFLIYPER